MIALLIQATLNTVPVRAAEETLGKGADDLDAYEQLQTSRSLLPAQPDTVIALLEKHLEPEFYYTLSDSILGQTHYVLGLAYYFKQYHRVAVYHNEMALRYLERDPGNRIYRATWNNLGVNHDLLEQWDESMAAYERAMELVTAIQDTFGTAQIHLNKGLISKNLQLYDSALYYTRLAQRTFTERNDRYHMGLALMNTALIYIESGDLELVAPSLLAARDLLRDSGQYQMEARALNNLAYFYYDHKDLLPEGLASARRYITESRELLLENAPEASLIYHNIMAMSVELTDGNFSRARTFFDAIMDDASLDQLASNYLSIVMQSGARLYALTGELDALKELIDHINGIKMEQSGRQARQAITESEVIKRVTLLQSTIQVQNEQIALQRFQLWVVSIVGLVLLVMLLVFLFMRRELYSTRLMYLSKSMLYKNNRIKPDFEGLSEFKNASRDDYFRQVCELLEAEQVYLDKNVKLEQMAKKLGTNTKYISRAINENTGLNFNKFINLYRVNKARDLLDKSKKNVSYIEIAEKSGFSNETTFYRNFKEITNATPREYQQRSRNSENRDSTKGKWRRKGQRRTSSSV